MRPLWLLPFLCACDDATIPDDDVETDLAFESIAIEGTAFTDLVFVPGRDDQVLIAEHEGLISHYQVDGDEADLLGSFVVPDVLQEGDCGLLTIAADPDWETNHFLFAGHCGPEYATHITRLTWDGSTYEGVEDTATEIVRIPGRTVTAPYIHSVGTIGFEDDGVMWVTIGDKGERVPPDPMMIRSSLLRIVPNRESDGDGYEVPDDNPFADGVDGAPEVYAYGFRYGWRAARDANGRYFVGDVGFAAIEEVNVVDAPGQQFGWNSCEGPCEGGEEPNALDPLLYWDHRVDSGPYFDDDPETEITNRRVVWVAAPQPADVVDRYDGLFEDLIPFGDTCMGWVRGVSVDDERNVTEDRHLAHLPYVVKWVWGPDGYAYLATFGSCDSAMMYEPSSLRRMVVD